MIIIKNGHIVGEEVLVGDLAIENGKIAEIAEKIEPRDGDEVIDASGCWVFPGFIDPHTHFDMTNAITTTADDYASGSEKAVLGGTTTVVNFASPVKGEPNTLHGAYNRERAKADGKASCNYRFHMELLDCNEEILKEIEDMEDLGVSSFKVYMAYGFAVTDEQIYRLLEKVKEVGGLLEAHCENGDLIRVKTEEVLAAGITTPKGHPLTRTPEIEAEAIGRLAYIGRAVDWPVHVVHLSTRLGLEEARHQREIGTAITLETCPQYLLLDDSKYELPVEESLKYIMSPPLRKPEDNEALLAAIANDEIQTLATDHCSYRLDTQKVWGKERFTKTPGGAPGVGERGPLAYTHLLASGLLTPRQFVDFLSTNAAKLYHMYPAKGVLAVGSDADIVLYEKDGCYEITDPAPGDRMDYNTYAGMEVEGRVRDVFLGGERIVADGVLVKPHLGQYVK